VGASRGVRPYGLKEGDGRVGRERSVDKVERGRRRRKEGVRGCRRWE